MKEKILTVLAALTEAVSGLTVYQVMASLSISAYDEVDAIMSKLIASGEVLTFQYGLNEMVYILAEHVKAIHATQYAAGADVFANGNFTIEPGETVLVVSSYKIPGFLRETPFLFLALARSSYWGNYRLFLTNGVGLIDTDFPDNVAFSYCNMGDEAVEISEGDKIGQLAMTNAIQFAPVANVERTGGFGSTDGVNDNEKDNDNDLAGNSTPDGDIGSGDTTKLSTDDNPNIQPDSTEQTDEEKEKPKLSPPPPPQPTKKNGK